MTILYDSFARPYLRHVARYFSGIRIPALPGQPRIGCKFPRFFYYVDYEPGRVNYYPLSVRGYGISRNFSGCVMAYFVFRRQPFIAHIALDGGSSARDMWNNFVIMNRSEIGKYVAFRPYGEGSAFDIQITRQAILARSVVGIITPGLRCFSVAVGFDYGRLLITEETDPRRKHMSLNLSAEPDGNLGQFLIPRMGHNVVW